MKGASMFESILILILVQAGIFGLFCAFIAAQKNRSTFGWFVIGFFFSFVAVLALIAIPANKFGNQQSSISSDDEEASFDGLGRGVFQGERELSSSKYQLFLVQKYGIEKNATLEKYISGNEVFNSLDDAINHADARYQIYLQGKLSKGENFSEMIRSIQRKV